MYRHCTTLTAALLVLCFGGVFTTVQAGDATAPGLVARFYEIGETMYFLPELAAGQTPSVAKVVPTIDLDSERGDFDPLSDRFLTEITGFFNISEDGLYGLRLSSDDGSQLWIDGLLVIDYDGLHSAEPKGMEVALAAGPHTLRVRHFQGGGGAALRLEWCTLGGKANADYAVIPADVLSHEADASLEAARGRKAIIPPLRRGLPGDGSPVAGMNPAFKLATVHDRDRGQNGAEAPAIDVRAEAADGKAGAFVWLPWCTTPPGEITTASLGEGLYAGQYVAAGTKTNELYRICCESADTGTIGCALRFAVVPGEGHRVSPVAKGVLLARASGLAGMEPDYIEPSGQDVFEMRAVRALSNGFEIEFTKPLDARCGWEADSYYVEQLPFDVTKQGPPRRDGVRYPVKSVSVSADRKTVFVEMEGLKPGHVVYLRLLPPCVSEDGQRPWSTEAWYTLTQLPQGPAGKVLTPAAAAPQNFLTDTEKAEGWKLLFDGKTTDGWRGYRQETMPTGWAVRDGCLVRVGSASDIITTDSFKDFELKLEWRICAGGNSGIFYRVNEDFDWPFFTGPEMQVLDNAEHADGRNALTSAGSNYALYAPARDVTRPVGLFNEVRIVAKGPHIEHWLNGVKVVECELWTDEWKKLVAESKFSAWPNYGLMKEGHIVLQDHGDQVWYRNIKIRPLSEQ
ncbi:MAG: DUF1080 domain-containing protein [Phycisphaerae bacterium]